MEQFNKAILDWKDNIHNLISKLIKESHDILSKLVDDLILIKKNHRIADGIRTSVDKVHAKAHSYFVSAQNQNDSNSITTEADKIKYLLTNSIETYKECMKTHFEKLDHLNHDSFDLVRTILDEVKKFNREQYATLSNDITELNHKLNEIMSKYQEISTNSFLALGVIIGGLASLLATILGPYFLTSLMSTFVSLAAAPIALITSIAIDEIQFRNKFNETLAKLDEYKTKQGVDLVNTRSEIDHYFDSLIDRSKCLLAGTFRIEQMVWFDLNVENLENAIYQEQIKSLLAPRHVTFSTFSDISQLENYVMSELKGRTILMVSGKSHEEVFRRCYQSTRITDVIVFAFNLAKYRDIRRKFDKVYRVVNSLESVIECIEDLLDDNTFNRVIQLNKLNPKLTKFNSDFIYSNFDEIPKEFDSYVNIINKAVELKLASQEVAEDEVKLFLAKISADTDITRISKAIIHLYTCESLYYKLVSKVLSNINEKNICECEIWIKALSLALKTMHSLNNDGDEEDKGEIKLYRSVNISDDVRVQETYKTNMAICFPAFTSTSADEQVALAFQFGRKRSILFEIDYDFAANSRFIPPVNISSYSEFKQEKEYLFSIFSIFRIKRIDEIDENKFKIFLTNNFSDKYTGTLI